MPLPFASGYQPINLLNDAIQNQAARQQQGYLQASQINEASISDAMNRIIQQKAIEQQGRNQQQHYGLQQQQLANDLAYRNQALQAAAAQQAQQGRQFDRVATMNEAIAKSQRERTDPSALAAALQINESNVAAIGTADGVNTAFEGARRTRDNALEEIDRIQKSGALRDQLKDVFTFDAGWATKKRDLQDEYRKAVGDIIKASQGKVTIRNRKHPQTGLPIPDDYEAVPLVMPQLQLPGQPITQPQPAQESSDAGPYPAAYGMPPQAVVPPVVKPFNVTGIARPDWADFVKRKGQPSNVRTNVPPASLVAPGGTNSVFTLTPDGKFIPVQ